ncbi:MAG: hypothetical protein ABIS50_17715 [Luteolibacter sp.]|uniref:hypothetical protein n=1 Tax=Luteolibacter sp. TaxID=1962973 RepID=UPI003267F6F0
MATDGAEFKRRVKYHGRTYTAIKDGSTLEVIADFSVAGMARELSGENPLHGFREMLMATVDCLQGILARDGHSLHQDLTSRLSQIAAGCGDSKSQGIAKESLIREAGEFRGVGSNLDSSAITDRLLSACGRDLHEALVIGYADQYAMQHRSLSAKDLPAFLDEWQRQASPRLKELMRSIFEDGRPAKEFLRVRHELVSIKSDSFADLTSINIGS